MSVNRFDNDTLEFFKKARKHNKAIGILLRIDQTDLNVYNIRISMRSTKVFYLTQKAAEKLEGKKIPLSSMQAMKFGRLVNKIAKALGLTISNISIERATILMGLFKKELSYEISSHIEKSYDLRKYHPSYKGYNSNLRSNCMAKQSRRKNLKFFEQNGVKIFLLKDQKGKILARCLLWKDCKNIKGETASLYDKIYYVHVMYSHAAKYYLKQLGYKPAPRFPRRDDKKFHFKLKKKKIYAKYPYLDTFNGIAYDFAAIANYQDDYFLARDTNSSALSNRIGKLEHLMVSCPKCSSEVLQYMLITDESRSNVSCPFCSVEIEGKQVSFRDITLKDLIRKKIIPDHPGLTIDKRLHQHKSTKLL